MDTDLIRRQLGFRLKQLRLAKGLKQEELEKWGFSYRYYGKLERGTVNPTIETLAKLCDIFDVSLSDLFRFLDEGHDELSAEAQFIIVKISQLMKENKKAKLKKLRLFLEEFL